MEWILTMKKLWCACLAILFISEQSQCYTIKEDESVRSAIHGGRFAEFDDAPYHVTLVYKGDYICGGALITLQHVLTAAHCITHTNMDSDNLKVYGGSHSLNKKLVKSNVAEMFIHPGYNKYYQHNFDIGVLALTRPFKKSNVISTIPLPQSPPRIGEKLLITGFGRFSSAVTRASTKMKKLVSVVTNCDQSLSPFTKTDLCLKNPFGRGVCHGDSGSPLVNQNLEVVGVASRVYGCAVGKHDVYTNVYYFLKFIKKIIKQTSADYTVYSLKHQSNRSIEDAGSKAIPNLLEEELRKNQKHWWSSINVNLIKSENNMEKNMTKNESSNQY